MDLTLTQSPDDLLTRLGTPDAPVLLDVRLPEDVAADPCRLPTARYVAHDAVRDWALAHRPGRMVVTICHKGLKLSFGAAAILRSAGHTALQLEGGNLAWSTAALPRIDARCAPGGGSTWVLPVSESPRALAAVWVIRRWFDEDAVVLWVPEPMLDDVAHRFDAHACNALPGIAPAFAARGLNHPALHHFLEAVDADTAAGTDLLAALPRLYPSAERRACAALPILDAAWASAQHQMREAA